jgi:hypothetical protein
VLQQRDTRYKEMHVPTQIMLRGVLCRVDADQDPEQLICQYVGQFVDLGTPMTLETSTIPTADQLSAVDEVLSAEDWSFEAE